MEAYRFMGFALFSVVEWVVAAHAERLRAAANNIIIFMVFFPKLVHKIEMGIDAQKHAKGALHPSRRMNPRYKLSFGRFGRRIVKLG